MASPRKATRTITTRRRLTLPASVAPVAAH